MKYGIRIELLNFDMRPATSQIIIPALIPKSFADLRTHIDVVRNFVNEVQVDIVDGMFVPFISWPYGDGEQIGDISVFTKDFVIEVDLMIRHPELVLEEYLRAGVQKVVIHVESTNALEEIFALKQIYPFLLGLSIHNNTDIQILLDTLHYADYVQLMGIANIGSQGQPFDERVLDTIRILKMHSPTLCISIDGSVNASSLPKLYDAGARRFVSGSAIMNAINPHDAYNSLTHIASKNSSL